MCLIIAMQREIKKYREQRISHLLESNNLFESYQHCIMMPDKQSQQRVPIEIGYIVMRMFTKLNLIIYSLPQNS